MPQLPLLRPLAYKAGNHQQNNEKGGQPESGSHISRADCSGFCMPIVHQLVEKMGGSITVESLPGKGTEFMLLFPLES